MRVSSVAHGPSARGDAHRRLAVDVTYDDGHPADELWIDAPVDSRVRPEAGDPWAVALLPLAVTLGEPLELDAPVDAALLSNLEALQRIWAGWFDGVSPVPIRADAAESRTASDDVGAAFSGGVDSFFTLLRDRERADPDERVTITRLITVWGFDLPVDREDAIQAVSVGCRSVAREVGVDWSELATNLRQTRWDEVDWAHLGHGCALAGVCHALAGSLGTVLIASGSGHQDLRPWASHPDTDPLLSSSILRFVHDGARFSRAAKLETISASPLVRRHLRVCFRSDSGENCGDCPKCVRTMLGLEVLGALADSTRVGGVRQVPVSRARRLHCRNVWDFSHTEGVRDLARERGRPDLADALERAMAGSKTRNRLLKVLDRVGRIGPLSRVARIIEDAAFRGWVR